MSSAGRSEASDVVDVSSSFLRTVLLINVGSDSLPPLTVRRYVVTMIWLEMYCLVIQ